MERKGRKENKDLSQRDRKKFNLSNPPCTRSYLGSGEISNSFESEFARAHDFDDVESGPGNVIPQHLYGMRKLDEDDL